MSVFSQVPQNFLLTSGANSALTWTNAVSVSSMTVSSLGASNLSVSTLTTSTSVSASSLVTSSITANSVGYSTLSGSTINATRLNYSSIVGSSISSNAMTLSLTNASTQNTQIYQVATTNPTTSYTAIQASHVSTGTTNNALVLNPSGGNVGVGTTAPAATLHVLNPTLQAGNTAMVTAQIIGRPPTGGLQNAMSGGFAIGAANAGINSVGRMDLMVVGAAAAGNSFGLVPDVPVATFLGSGNVGIGTTNPTSKLTVSATSETDAIRFFNTANSSTGSISLSVATAAGSFIINGTANAGVVLADQDLFLNRDSSLNCAMVIKSGTGNVGIGTPNPGAKLQVNGSLAKSSGTFDIPHPLHPDTNKRLVHSFIEGPRCDLIYRGKTTLVDGSAVVNIDKECTHSPECAMDDGTFEALCDNPQVFLQNNKTFDRVRGVVSGATLTITCESQAAVEIEWMVIAERADPFIKQWDRTNPDGYLITQYSSAEAPDAPAAAPDAPAAPAE